MRVRDLGALVVAQSTQEQPVVGIRGAAMLALLTINVNQRVSVDALMAAAWGDQVSAGMASTLASHIWRLRRVLEPGRDRRQSPAVLLNDNDGYRLVGGPATVDSVLFAEASVEVRDLLAGGHPDAAVRRADSALALWRGRPYGGFADAEWARPAVTRLEELHGQMLERRIEGLIASGAVPAAVSDLQPIVEELPFRESLRVLQMQALYLSGRREEALQAYQQARRLLLDEIGIEPGDALQAMQRRILSNDPALNRQAGQPAPASNHDVEVHLPAALAPLVGRAEVIAQLVKIIRDRSLITVTGAAGSGKTRVAVEAARAVAQHFPDGVWLVDLTAVSDFDLVVDVVVSTIGFAPSVGAAPLQDLSRYLHSRRVLLVLDNCEHVLPGVEKIIQATLDHPGGAPECVFLTTSREPINIEGETIWTLDPLRLPDDGDSLRKAASAPAVELFLQRLGTVAPTMAQDDEVLARAREISVAVDGLPLALELAAARALSHSLADIAAQVTVDPSRLSRVGRGPKDHRRTVRAAIEWSHQLLSPDEALAHRRLSVLPGSFTADLAATVIGTTAESDDVDDLLARLVHRSLLSSEVSADPRRRTKFRQLATVRSHAHHALDDAGETRMCLDSRDAWTAALLAARPPLGSAAEVEWHRRIDDDYATVRATLARLLINEPDARGGRLAYQLTFYWYYHERLVEGSRWLELGYDSLSGAEPTDELVARLALATLLVLQRRLDLANSFIDELGEQVQAVPPGRLVEVGEVLVGLCMSAYTSESYELLLALHPILGWVVGHVDNDNLSLLVDAVGSCALLVNGDGKAAVELALSVQERADRANHPFAGFISTAPLIIGALKTNRPQEGLPWVDRCAAQQLRLGTGAVGMFMETKGNFAAQLGDFSQATRMYAAARTATRRAGMIWPNRAWTEPLLALTREQLRREEYEQAWQAGEHLTAAQVFQPAPSPRFGPTRLTSA